jgi:hypothetical protein
LIDRDATTIMRARVKPVGIIVVSSPRPERDGNGLQVDLDPAVAVPPSAD